MIAECQCEPRLRTTVCPRSTTCQPLGPRPALQHEPSTHHARNVDRSDFLRLIRRVACARAATEDTPDASMRTPATSSACGAAFSMVACLATLRQEQVRTETTNSPIFHRPCRNAFNCPCLHRGASRGKHPRQFGRNWHWELSLVQREIRILSDGSLRDSEQYCHRAHVPT